jgi:alkanesulfonate monooxygenase SsuD/methylene tetrahydromethanopterin reductase-like flavin-dependent oxidoreductase (luciferase family)
VHPVFAAKSIVTADHVGHGRFGINIVSGWNVEEFAMFGIPLREHDERYAYSAEWVSILKKVHAGNGPFDYEGKYFNLKNVDGKPKPWGDGRPMLMSAGSSPAGRKFAVDHVDCLFMVITEDARIDADVAQARATPGAENVGLYASGHLLCRRTAKETEEYYHYLVREKGDWEAAEQIIAKRAAGNSQSLSPELMRKMKERVISGGATFPVIGSYDEVAEKFLRLSQAGLDGMALILVNYVNEMPVLRDEVLPRLERLKIREARRH